MVWVRPLLGVPILEALILGSTACILASIYLAYSIIQDSFQDLDMKLAGAIGKLLEDMPSPEFEPMNPLQSIIAQAIAAKMAPPAVEVTEIQRNPKGQFQSK